MSSSTVVENAKELIALWRVALKPCPPPAASQFLYWSANYPLNIMNRAIVTTAQRNNVPLNEDATRVYRYVSGMARNMLKETVTAETASSTQEALHGINSK
jgi:hypothetical protein